MSVPSAEVERRVQAFVRTCRRQGMKVTHQRMEIFRELAASMEHPDAETVYQAVRGRVPSVSRDTVYRTLATLEVEGLVRRVEPLAKTVRYDANSDRHHHFACTDCGLVRDFYSEVFDNLPIPEAVEALGEIALTQVQVRGICSACLKRRNAMRQRGSE